MNTREQILAAVLKNQPSVTVLPDIGMFNRRYDNNVAMYMEIFKSIGGSVFQVKDSDEIITLIRERFDVSGRMVTSLPELANQFELLSADADPYTYENIEL